MDFRETEQDAPGFHRLYRFSESFFLISQHKENCSFSIDPFLYFFRFAGETVQAVWFSKFLRLSTPHDNHSAHIPEVCRE